MPNLAAVRSDDQIRVDRRRKSVFRFGFANHHQLGLLHLSHFYVRHNGPCVYHFCQLRFELTNSCHGQGLLDQLGLKNIIGSGLL